ncbi:dTDP-4-dehydrorhamnose reductase [Rhodohalobacter sp. SW132]|uniref:dTDP-4-dehydrorhamnose reductase n=1 Tax=Rhodohalobacter sp. SW132 TaxID=2293433 RepID=UPI000E24B4BD|nr:dTDP-4-dehydrorhamnose reductase [Rhodohalobacter sp. SW132]REL24609.1 dTDP-4-dehydrorhamnose reductase [Rhodohalobacter sp. SW132]
MKILITGAGGQLGREWMHFLENGEHQVHGFGSDQFDITDHTLVSKIMHEIRPDLLINCAAYTAVDKAEEEPETAYSVNDQGAENLARICRELRCKLVHFSTDYVFGGTQHDHEKMPEGYPESYPTDPQNVYGASKRAGELKIESEGGNWLIIRVSWLCGQFGNNFVKTMLRLSGERDELKVVDDQTGSPTYCTDLVNKTMRLVEMDQKGYFHISSEGSVTWYGLTRELLNQSGRLDLVKLKAVGSDEFPVVARRPAFSLLNCSKLKSAGLKPIPWKTGLKQLLNQLNKKKNIDEN